MLKGRYGIGWMVAAWSGLIALAILAIIVALWAGPQIAGMLS